MKTLSTKGRVPDARGPAIIRPFDPVDWESCERLLKGGKGLCCFDLSRVEQALLTPRGEESPPTWPTGGIWVGERNGEIEALVRVLSYPTRVEVRRAITYSQPGVPLLIELTRFVMRQCARLGVQTATLGEDFDAAALPCILDGTPWSPVEARCGDLVLARIAPDGVTIATGVN